MTSKQVYPSLNADGLWDTNSYSVADQVFADFYTCDASQSFAQREIQSMSAIVANNQRDMENLCRELQFAIEIIFSDYFNTVVVNVTHSNADVQTTKAELTIRIMIVDTEGTEINIGKLFSIEGSKFSIIANLIQG